MEKKTQRLFFALDIDDQSKEKIIDLISQLQSENNAFFRWTLKENLHITIQFLGNVTTEQELAYSSAVQKSLSAIQPFHIKTGCLISLPISRHPHLIALSIKNTSELEMLFETVNATMVDLGVAKERYRFVPHITLARAKKHPEEIIRLLKKEYPFSPIDINVDKLILFKSSNIGGQQGSIYTALDEFRLSSHSVGNGSQAA